MSGRVSSSHSTRRGRRALIPLMLKVAIFIAPLWQERGGLERRQIAKLDPQPQPEAALGFSTLNDDPPSESTKSTVQPRTRRSEEHTSELQSLMRISYAVLCLKKKNTHTPQHHT